MNLHKIEKQVGRLRPTMKDLHNILDFLKVEKSERKKSFT